MTSDVVQKVMIGCANHMDMQDFSEFLYLINVCYVEWNDGFILLIQWKNILTRRTAHSL